jgi:chromosome segregation ATPase
VRILDRVALVVVLLGLGLTMLSIFHKSPAPSDAITKTADSLASTRPAVEARLDSSAESGRKSAAAQRAIKTREAASEQLADQERARGDSLERRANAAHTLQLQVSFLQSALQARTLETAELRYQLEKKDERIAWLVGDTVRLSADLDVVRRRNYALEDFTRRLQRDLAKANDCTIAFGVRCPSRTEVAIGAVVIETVVAAVAAARP